ncbi:MAG TPA: hypothetical protein VN698_15245 [Bacteroidia bacterium]|nr:hypothetical protein [Bacteroidia bacterium]
MKIILKYIAIFFLFFCIELNAQEAGTNSVVPSKTTAKGRRELRKDKRIKRHEKRAEKAKAENFETKSDKPFHKKRNRKALKKQKNTEVRKKG